MPRSLPFRGNARIEIGAGTDDLSLSPSPAQEKGLTQRAAVCVSLGTAVFALSAVCFGVSPLKTLDIFIWSFFFSTLVGMPGACLLTSDLASWQRAYVTLRPQSVSERVCCVTFCSAALGAWLGTWAVPLDWRASWQEWPIPCFLGSVGGCLAGSAVLARGLGLAEEREREEEGRRSREREKYEAEGRKKREGLEKPEVNEANWWMFM